MNNKTIPQPFLKIVGNRPGLTIQYFASRSDAMKFAAANPTRVSLSMFGTMSGTKEGRDYVALNVFTPSALRRELADIVKEDRDRAARVAARERDIASGKVVLPSEIIPTELGL